MFDCILLAAGASSRMAPGLVTAHMNPERETTGMPGFKPLLPFGGSTLVETAAKEVLEAGCRVLLVLGFRGGEVGSLFAAPTYVAQRASGGIVALHNPRWAAGMVGSIQAALPLVEGEAFFIAHADMPFVSAADYCALFSAWQARYANDLGPRPPSAALFASWRGRAGHPVLVPSAWIPAILELGAGERIKPFLGSRPAELVETGPGALRDIDTPSDYEAALRDAASSGPCGRGGAM
jgi:Uncharacterized MobA-related protein